MRISDWSSDVCSSDLFHLERQTGGLSRVIERGTKGIEFVLRFMTFNILPTLVEIAMVGGILWWLYSWSFAAITVGTIVGRSAEHTSELQSLMSNSYAVFCLNKKIKKQTAARTDKVQTISQCQAQSDINVHCKI